MITIVREKDKKTSRYYMKGGLGCALHTHHAKENRVTWHSGVYSNELSEQVEKVFQDIGCHNVSFSIAQDMIHERTGEYISYNRDIKTAGDDLVNCMRRTGNCIYSFLLHNIEEDKSPLSRSP